MPVCPCQQAGECPMELIPDCAACEGFSTMGYMAAMAYRLEARVAALESFVNALCGLKAGGPEPAAPEQAAAPQPLVSLEELKQACATCNTDCCFLPPEEDGPPCAHWTSKPQPRNCDNCQFAKVSEWKPPCFDCQLHGGTHDAWQPRSREGGSA